MLLLAGVPLLTTDGEITNINYTTREKLDGLLTLALDGQSALGTRVILVNLSEQLRRFHECLAHFHPQPEDLAIDVTGKPKFKRAAKQRRRGVA